MTKRYDVIYEKEPRGQVVTDNGIPCTARTCVTRLNRLTEENEQLKQRITTQSVDREQLCKRIDEVRKENEQLKTQLSEQGTQIDFLKDENHHMRTVLEENEQLKQKISELELLNDGLNYALRYIKKIDVEIDVGDVE